MPLHRNLSGLEELVRQFWSLRVNLLIFRLFPENSEYVLILQLRIISEFVYFLNFPGKFRVFTF